MIDLKEVLTESDLQQFATIDDVDYYRMIKTVIQAIVKRDREKINISPRLCPEDLKEDLRYILGGVNRLEYLLSLPQEARDLIREET